jgi:hypothetical protein
MDSPLSSVVRSASKIPRLTSLSVTDGETETLRKEYLSLITKVTWIQELMERCVIFPDQQSVTVDVTANGKIQQLKTPFCIGRQEPTIVVDGMPAYDHLSIGDFPEISRCHVIVASINNELYVIDPGSLLGIRTVKRGLDLPLEFSVQHNRKVLKFQENEPFILKIGYCDIGFNLPKDDICCVCLFLPASIRYQPCNHCVICSVCSEQITSCPVCRENIEKRIMSVTNQTYKN